MGLRAEHDAADLAYAVMEGVGFGLLDGLNAMRAGSGGQGAMPEAGPFCPLVGGWRAQQPLAQLLASAPGTPLQRPEGAHAAAALGAARLRSPCGDEAHCANRWRPMPFQPQPAQQALLAERYARFVALYPALQAQF